MPKLKPLSLSNKGITIKKPLALMIHLAITGATSASLYALASNYQQQQQQQQFDYFTKQAVIVLNQHARYWQQQAQLLAQQPGLKSAATLKAVVPVDGTVPPSLNYADQDLLNRTRSKATTPELTGNSDTAMASTALAMPAGGYALFEWPAKPLMDDLKAITANTMELKLSQEVNGAEPVEILRIHSHGNDGLLKNVALTTSGWQLGVRQHPEGALPIWAALLSLLGGLLTLGLWGIRKPTIVSVAVAQPAPYQSELIDSSIVTASDADSESSTPDIQVQPVTTPIAPVFTLEKPEENPDKTAQVSKDAVPLEFNLDDALLPDLNLDVASAQLPQHLFRAYNIRGSVDELTNKLISQIGRALGAQLRQQDQYQVVVGYDARTSSPGYARLIQQALSESGLTVIDVGMVTTPILYFAAAQHDGNGIMITASHNPASDNGIKWLIQQHSPSPEAVQEIFNRVKNNEFVEGLGTIRSQSYTEQYLMLLQDDVILSQPIAISIDTMNGSAGEFALAAFNNAGCTVSSLNTEANGVFPNGSPDPSKAEYLQELGNDIVISGSQIGFAFDGDGDRLVVLDSQGNPVSPDHLIILFAKMCLDSNPGSDIIIDVKCSRIISNIVTSAGGRAVMVRTGNTFLREALHDPQYQAVFAGEFSGHYFFNDQRGHAQDDGIYAALRLLEWLDSTGQTIEQALDDLPQHVSTPDMYLPLKGKDARELLAQFESDASQLMDAKITTIDGVRLDFNTGFGIIRPSNTGDYLTARFDADTADNLQLIRTTFSRLLIPYDEQLAQLILE